jgi:hypothetical protein
MQFNQGGVPLAGGKLFTYAAGTTNKQATYTDSTGSTPNTNPIILDSNGQCDLWLTDGVAYKLVLSPSTDTDPPTNAYWSKDNISTTQLNTTLLSLTVTGAASIGGNASVGGNMTVTGNETVSGTHAVTGNATVGGTLTVTGAVSGASFNKVIITQPATTATLTIANNKTFTASNTVTFSGTDGAAVNVAAGGTVAYTGSPLSQFAATTSAQLLGVISDATGTGKAVFATDPTFTLSDTTTNDASTLRHGWMPKLPGGTTTFWRADGTFATPNPAFTTAPVGGGTLTIPTVYYAFLSSGSYTLPDITGSSNFGLVAPTNAPSVPTSVTFSDNWTLATGFSAGTLSMIAPSVTATPHGVWQGLTMTPPTDATLGSLGTSPTIAATVMMPNNILCIVFTDSGGTKIVAYDITNKVFGSPVTLNATAGTLITAFQDTTTTIVVGYKPGAAKNAVTALSLSGTTLTAGSELSITNLTANATWPLVKITTGYYAAAVDFSGAVTVVGVTVGGTSCSQSTAGATGSIWPSSVTVPILPVGSNTAVLIGAASGAAPVKAQAVLVTFSGGNAPTFGSTGQGATAIEASASPQVAAAYGDGVKFLAGFQNNSVSTTTDWYLIDCSGATPSFGTVVAQTTSGTPAYTYVTFNAGNGISQQVGIFSTTQILIGAASGGPIVAQNNSGTLAIGTSQLSGQTAGKFVQGASGAWYFIGSSAFDRISSVSGTTINSAEQVVAVPNVFLSTTVNDKASKYSSTWYTWTIPAGKIPISTSKYLGVSGTTFTVYGSVT